MDSRDDNPYKNLNTAFKFFDCCVEHLAERTQYDWASEEKRVEYNNRIFIFISQEDMEKVLQIPRQIKTWVPPPGKKGTQSLHSVRSTRRTLKIQVGI